MKRILSSLALAALAAAFLPGNASALSEAEYSALLESSPQIAALDKRLNQEWKQALAKMKPQGRTCCAAISATGCADVKTSCSASCASRG